MKKLLLFTALITLAFISNAQTAKIAGSWLMTKVEINGEVEEPNFITDFKDNGKMEIMEMEIGSWTYNKQKNSIEMISPFDKDFNGESKILMISDEEMVLMKDEAKLSYVKIDRKQILKDNEASGLAGTWKIQGPDDAVIILKFELPDAFLLVEAEEGMTSKSGGMWIYNSTSETVFLMDLRDFLEGESKIIKHSDTELELENNGNSILAVKVNTELNKIERLGFTEEDFYTENWDYKYNDEGKLPWLDSYGMLTSLKEVKHLVYKYSKLIEDTEAYRNKTLTANVNANMEEQSLSIDYIFYGYDTYNLPEDTQLPPNTEYTELLFPEKDMTFRVTGTEQITTPAGTFDCTVIEALGDSDVRKKLWLINNKPGIYAKIIHDNPDEWGYYAVYELQGIE